MPHLAKVSTTILRDGEKTPVTVRGTGDAIFMALALMTDEKLSGVPKKNKLDKELNPDSFPNRGRFKMTLTNLLRAHNRKNDVTVGKITIPAGGVVTDELTAAFEAAEERANSYRVKAETARINAREKAKQDKEKEKAQRAQARQLAKDDKARVKALETAKPEAEKPTRRRAAAKAE